LARSRDALGMIWEIDGRRPGFHERCGGLALPQPYLQPPVDGSTLLPMQLMFRPSHGASPPDAETVRAMIRAMYAEKYHAMNGIPIEVLSALSERSRR